MLVVFSYITPCFAIVFLDAPLHLYKRGPLVGLSVHLNVIFKAWGVWGGMGGMGMCEGGGVSSREDVSWPCFAHIELEGVLSFTL